jgi:hypothetical protein
MLWTRKDAQAKSLTEVQAPALRHVDLGAGSGYFVAALRLAGAATPIGRFTTAGRTWMMGE